ncbi:heme uptake protein IsdC [Paenibacillus cellulosilyticus]|uniref:Heme uptake protein IsdC n=1 Tax=Paenibacillus cellulosilyticus TaxID=375489 RepID=A0A2V2YUI6_9BACL|nr:heme uptake protein IsdC [Paenibacillus cellulosilyticus]PWW03287.1 heme uptake protein IsdC [Paenibacillus cellulosilyticus]QKS43765.1 heme uptake protein IsdC [Paenibacillus cellulosilyticus]
MIRNMRLLSLLLVGVWVMLIASLPVSAASKLAAGTYSFGYEVLRAEDDSVSIANDYWEKPATVTVGNDGYTVRMTLNHSKWIVAFSVPSSSGSYVSVTKISEDTAADKRVVEFKTDDLSKPIEAKIHVIVEEIGYDHKYTIRLSFDEDSASLIKAAEEKAPEKESTAVEQVNDEKSTSQTTTTTNSSTATTTTTTTTTPTKQTEKNNSTTASGSTSEEKPASTSTAATSKPAQQTTQSGKAAETTTSKTEVVNNDKAKETKATETAKPADTAEVVAADSSTEETATTTGSTEGTTVDAASSDIANADSTKDTVEAVTPAEDTAADASAAVETLAAAPEDAVVEEANSGSRIVNAIVFIVIIIAAGAAIVWVKRRKQNKGT